MGAELHRDVSLRSSASRLDIRAIAVRVCYVDPTPLARVLVRATGTTPSAW